MTYKKKVLVRLPRQIQADWNQSDNTKVDYIKNRLSDAIDTNEDGTVPDNYLNGDIFIYDDKYYVAKNDGTEGDIVINPTKFSLALNSIDASYISIIRKMSALNTTQDSEQSNEQNNEQSNEQDNEQNT